MRAPAALLLLTLAVGGCGERDPARAEPPAVGVAPAPAARSPTPPSATDSAPAAPAPAADGARYTSLEGCRLLRAIPDEAGYSEELCPGVDGYAVRRSEADGRQNLFLLAPGGAEFNLHLPSGGGGGFSTLGPQVEWRGSPAAAMIFRYAVVTDPEQPERPVSSLIVMRLRPEPCLIARVPPGPGQNAEARRLADTATACTPLPD